jgi:hypothetical protein
MVAVTDVTEATGIPATTIALLYATPREEALASGALVAMPQNLVVLIGAYGRWNGRWTIESADDSLGHAMWIAMGSMIGTAASPVPWASAVAGVAIQLAVFGWGVWCVHVKEPL